MRRLPILSVVFTIAATACRSGAPLLPADAIVEGRTTQPVAVDTVEGSVTVSVDRGSWKARAPATRPTSGNASPYSTCPVPNGPPAAWMSAPSRSP